MYLQGTHQAGHKKVKEIKERYHAGAVAHEPAVSAVYWPPEHSWRTWHAGARSEANNWDGNWKESTQEGQVRQTGTLPYVT